MKKNRLFLILLVITCWSSFSFMKGKDFKRFLPASIAICMVTKYLNSYAKRKNFWSFKQSIHPKIPGEDVWTWGPFFTVSMWVLKSTYRKLPLYIAVNFMIHTTFTFVVVPKLKKDSIFKFKKINPFQYVTILTVRQLLLYGFQHMSEFIMSKKLEVKPDNGEH
ncbi:hypothetical protein ACLZHR_09450 [Priestia aryabhattai]|uniref:hypothetical protein n=1 Tax=Priestia aryabhattai TaxID=412384 RepID=UPI003A813564